jgi:hypothetical protein
VNAWIRLETVNVLELVDLEVVSSSSEVVRDPARRRTAAESNRCFGLMVHQARARGAPGRRCSSSCARSGAITSGALEGAIAKTRGVAGTTVAIILRRGDQTLQLLVRRRKIHA